MINSKAPCPCKSGKRYENCCGLNKTNKVTTYIKSNKPHIKMPSTAFEEESAIEATTQNFIRYALNLTFNYILDAIETKFDVIVDNETRQLIHTNNFAIRIAFDVATRSNEPLNHAIIKSAVAAAIAKSTDSLIDYLIKSLNPPNNVSA